LLYLAIINSQTKQHQKKGFKYIDSMTTPNYDEW